jgi:hypothetical protein
MFCQDGSPSIGLSESYGEDQLFSFNFSQNMRVPRLPEFADWAQEHGDSLAISFDKEFCEIMIQEIGPELDGKIPVSRGQGFFEGWRLGGCTPAFLPLLIYTLNFISHLSYLLILIRTFFFSFLAFLFSPDRVSVPCVLLWAGAITEHALSIQNHFFECNKLNTD